MTRVAGSLVEATERDVIDGENRVTEVLAAVLQTVPDLSKRLLQAADLPTGVRYEVSTQVSAEGKSVDLELLATDEHGRSTARLWAEHKVDARFGPDEIRNYRERLDRRRAEPATLAVVAPSDRLGALMSADQGVSSNDVRWMSWQTIGILADACGRESGGRRWREHALEPDVPASQRLLEESLGTLERKGLAYMDPLSNADVFVLANAADARETLIVLLERALQHLGGLRPGGPRSRRNADTWWHHLDGADSWVTARYGGHAEVLYADDDWWRRDDAAMETACIGAGYTIPRERGIRLLAESYASWHQHLSGGRIDLAEDGAYVRCFGTLYLNEVVTAGVTLDDQACHIAAWIEAQVAHIDGHPPPKR